MHIRAITLTALIPPKDNLFLKIKESSLSLKEGDIVCVTSKVVSIHEGRVVPMQEVLKDTLAMQEADYYLPRMKTPFGAALHTITKGNLIRSAGIDESNGNGYYILWPQSPMKSARMIRTFLSKEYGVKNVGVVITDSTSHPLRRGVSGFALAYDGISPLKDYRGTTDIFGRIMQTSMANVVDALASAAVLKMGEGDERTPIALIRGLKNLVPGKKPKKPWNSFFVSPKEDIFAPFLLGVKWKKGKTKS